jgi:hypothetical protein
VRHLTSEQALNNLRLGKPLEQWLGTKDDAGDVVLRWVRVRLVSNRGYVVTLYEGIEDTNASGSIYDTLSLESDQDGAALPVDAAGREFIFDSEGGAIAFVAGELGGTRDRFVNDGLVQEEYLDARP